MNQNMTVLRKHIRPHVATDSCQRHGIGLSKCRVCIKNDRVGDSVRTARHRADVDTLVGLDVRMFSL